MQTNNKLREAAEKTKATLEKALQILNGISDEEAGRLNARLEDVADAICEVTQWIIPDALAEPVRNCDLYRTKEEAQAAFLEEACDHPCGNCWVEDINNECGVDWLLGPATEKEATMEKPECAIKSLSLDEAIAHADEVAGDCGTACKREHKQLADWLRELKSRRSAERGDCAKSFETVGTRFDICQDIELVLKIGRDYQNKDGNRGAHYDTVKLLCDAIEYQQEQLETKAEVGDCAKLREAAEFVAHIDDNGYTSHDVQCAIDKARAALAATEKEGGAK